MISALIVYDAFDNHHNFKRKLANKRPLTPFLANKIPL